MALIRRERVERPDWFHFEVPDMFRRMFDLDWEGGWLRVEEFTDERPAHCRIGVGACRGERLVRPPIVDEPADESQSCIAISGCRRLPEGRE